MISHLGEIATQGAAFALSKTTDAWSVLDDLNISQIKNACSLHTGYIEDKEYGSGMSQSEPRSAPSSFEARHAFREAGRNFAFTIAFPLLFIVFVAIFLLWSTTGMPGRLYGYWR